MGASIWAPGSTVSLDSAALALLSASGGSALVGFIQAGSGAVIRTMQEKERERVSITDFMTVAQKADYLAGTLLIDCASAYNAAFAITGREVFLPKGNGRIDSNLNQPVCEAIVGEGPVASKITAAAGVTKVLRLATTASNLSALKGFSVHGNATAAAIGIAFGDDDGTPQATCSNIDVQDVQVHDFTGAGAIGAEFRNIVKSNFYNFFSKGCETNEKYVKGTGTDGAFQLNFYGGESRSATGIGCHIVAGYDIRHYGRHYESNALEGLKIIPAAGVVCSGIKIIDPWFEANRPLDPTNYQFVADGSAAGCTVNLILDRPHFASSAATAKSIKLTGANTIFDLNNPQCVNDPAQILVSAGAAGNILLPYNLAAAFLTLVADSGNTAVDMNLAGDVWTAYTPTYSSNIGNMAATFTAAGVTTTLARYKRVGRTLHIVLNWSGTLLAVTPAYIKVSLPTGFVSQSNAGYTSTPIQSLAGTVETGLLRSSGSTFIYFYRANLAAFGSAEAIAGYCMATIELSAVH